MGKAWALLSYSTLASVVSGAQMRGEVAGAHGQSGHCYQNHKGFQCPHIPQGQRCCSLQGLAWEEVTGKRQGRVAQAGACL